MDIVYLWCDGNDKGWRKKRERTYDALDDFSFLTSYANVEGRFRDNGELMYSLRSLELYYPHHGDIYIITDSQIPPYLKNNGNIKFLFHKDILPHTPTFSSKAIEASIPFIPEISDDFLYCNDDVFFGPQFSEELFLADARYHFYFFHQNSDTADELIEQSHFASKILNDQRLDNIQSAHTPKVISKFLYSCMAQEYSSLLGDTQKEQFRDQRNLSFLADFFPRWMYHHGYADIALYDRDVSIGTSKRNYEQIYRDFENLPFFGINDTSDDLPSDHEELLLLKDTLASLFPNKSLFEY